MGLERLVDADLARLARPARLAGSAPDRQANALDRTPHRPAMRKPVVRSAEGPRPRLGRAIISEAHPPPPSDHPDLPAGPAGRAGAEDTPPHTSITFPPVRLGHR